VVVAVAGCALAVVVSFIHFREVPAAPGARATLFVHSGVSRRGHHLHAPRGDLPEREAYCLRSAGKLWIRDLDQEDARQLSGGDNVIGPFWSPDSEFVGFAAGKDLEKISVHGGAAIRLCMFGSDYRGGAWSLDGSSIVYSLGGLGLIEIPAQGGTSKAALPIVQGASFFAPLPGNAWFCSDEDSRPAEHRSGQSDDRRAARIA
jgi:hypothetical protein